MGVSGKQDEAEGSENDARPVSCLTDDSEGPEGTRLGQLFVVFCYVYLHFMFMISLKCVKSLLVPASSFPKH